jgi:hypothetical protein
MYKILSLKFLFIYFLLKTKIVKILNIKYKIFIKTQKQFSSLYISNLNFFQKKKKALLKRQHINKQSLTFTTNPLQYDVAI